MRINENCVWLGFCSFCLQETLEKERSREHSSSGRASSNTRWEDIAMLSCTVEYMFPYMCCKRTLMHPHADIHTSHSHTCRCKDIHRVPHCIQTLPIPQAVRTLQLSPCNYTERKQALQRLTNGTFIKNSYIEGEQEETNQNQMIDAHPVAWKHLDMASKKLKA